VYDYYYCYYYYYLKPVVKRGYERKEIYLTRRQKAGKTVHPQAINRIKTEKCNENTLYDTCHYYVKGLI